MREREFERLVNLCLDDEISEDERTVLEREIREDPKRRETWESYLCLEEATRRASPAAFAESAGLVDLLSGRFWNRSRVILWTSSGVAAAAAIIAFVAFPGALLDRNRVPQTAQRRTLESPAPIRIAAVEEPRVDVRAVSAAAITRAEASPADQPSSGLEQYMPIIHPTVYRYRPVEGDPFSSESLHYYVTPARIGQGAPASGIQLQLKIEGLEAEADRVVFPAD